MRFLADVGVSLRIVEQLRLSGHDVIHLSEEGLQTLPDPEIFQKARDEQRTLLTFDLDFGEIVAASAGGVVSVVLFRLHNTRSSFVLARLLSVLKDSSSELMDGAVVVIEEARHRIRRLPIGR